MDSTADPAVAYVLCDDLMFGSRITGTARALGLQTKTARSPEVVAALVQQQAPSCVLVDLANPGLVVEELIRVLREKCPTMPRVVAFGSHVDAATLHAAREAGCDPVLPRSRFVEELAGALAGWVGR